MTVMTAEFAAKDKIAVPYADREFLRLNQKPPSHWRIWIGAQQRHYHAMFSHNVLSFTTKEKPEVPFVDGVPASNTQTTTICLGQHLLIYAMSSPIGRSIIRRWQIPNPIAGAVTQIWPVKFTRVDWPLEVSLNDKGIYLLASDFFDKATNLNREIERNRA